MTGIEVKSVTVEMATKDGTDISGYTINKICVEFTGGKYYYTLNAATWATDTYPTVNASNNQQAGT